MCPTPNRFQNSAISLYSSKIIEKKEILLTVCNTGVYCSSEKVGTVYIFENSTVNINALSIISKGLWRWYISTNIMFLDIIHRPVFI
jgi:hypothetical protein